MERNKKIILGVALLLVTAIGGYLIYRAIKKDKSGVTAETKKQRIFFTRA